MSAVIRTVRKLEGLPEVKRVGDITIETGIPLPPRQVAAGVSAVLRVMEVGESFVHGSRISTRHLDKYLGTKKFAQRKLGTKYRIWRIQ